jgi:beta-N-acetylhexosaminidase
MNMAPVADVDSQDRAGLLAVQRRTFGTEPRVVGELVGAAVAGMQDAGVSAVLKHFPGQGAASLDPHTTRVELPQTREELEATDLVPFRYGLASGARAVMTAHVAYPAVTGDDLPATVSRPIIHHLLRGGMGYDGLVITYALNMDAIGSSRSEGELAIAAILAGADMILKPVDPEQVVRELVRAMESGMLPRERVEESVKRILRTKLEAGLFGPAPVVFHEDPMERLGAESHRAVVDEIRQVARLWRPQ